MLNYETLLSNYDDKLTLMQWLKKVETALKDASAVSFDVVNLGNATFKFKIVFEDGSDIESDPLVINQGDSVASAAIVNGHLILTLTNGEEIDAGSMFDGDVNITGSAEINGTLSVGNNASVDGNLDVNGEVVADTLKQTAFNFSQAFNLYISGGLTLTNIYNRFAEINNVLHVIVNFSLTNNTEEAKIVGSGYNYLGLTSLTLPSSIASKIVDIEGNRVSEANVTTDTLIASEPAQALKDKVLNSQSLFANARITLVNRNAENACSIAVALNGAVADRITLNPTESLYVTARMALTLL